MNKTYTVVFNPSQVFIGKWGWIQIKVSGKTFSGCSTLAMAEADKIMHKHNFSGWKIHDRLPSGYNKPFMNEYKLTNYKEI